MKRVVTTFSLFGLLWFIAIGNLVAQSTEIISAGHPGRTLPFGADWAKKRGIDLPSPFGISTFFTYMSRGVDVTDVSVALAGREPESISEFASFAVKNQTYVTALRFDAWILPVLNVYGLVGYAGTNSGLNANIMIDRSLPLPPVDINLQTATVVKGPYLGMGTSLVAGYKSWFVLGDINYGKNWPDKLNNTVSFTMVSLRSGLSGKMGDKNNIRGWLGGAYMGSKCTLEIKAPTGSIGDIMVTLNSVRLTPGL